jgi:hypothetical protein
MAGHAFDSGRQLRVVGQRRADADRHGVAFRTPVVRPAAACFIGDPLRVAGVRGHLAVQRHRRLEEHPGTTRARALAERLVLEPGPGRQVSVDHHHVHPLVAQDAEATARGVRAGVVGGDHDAADSRPEDRLRARRRPSVVAARLERDVEGGSMELRSSGGSDCLHLGVGSAEGAMKALAEGVAVTADDRAYERVRTDETASAFCQFDRPRQVMAIRIGDYRHAGYLSIGRNAQAARRPTCSGPR